MKLYSIYILFLTCICTSTTAQTIIRGKLSDYEKNELIAASIRCYCNDTVFIKGTTTNNKGEFELHVPAKEKTYKLLFSYLGYKDLSLKLNPTQEKDIRLGEICMSKDIEQIQEVTILGENTIRTEDKIMIYPTKEQLRHAYNGYSTVEVLMIPGLRSSFFQPKPTYHGKSVLMCIDGREATDQEIKDLNAKDIKRVDFYDNGRPDYPDASTVLDFILKERNYAGSVATNAGSRLTAPFAWGEGKAQYFQNKSEFAISASGAYQHLNKENEISTQTTYHFPQNGITKKSQELPSMQEITNFRMYMNYLYLDKTRNFYTSLRFNRESWQSDTWKQHHYHTSDIYKQQEYKKGMLLSPSMQLRYNQILKNRQNIRLELYGSYGNNDYDRWYEYKKDEIITSSYNNATDERSLYTSFKANYTKTFKNKSSLNIELSQNFTHAKDKNIRYDISNNIYVNKGNTRIYATYNYRIKNKLNLQARLAEHLSYTHTDGNSVFSSFFIPSVKLTYTHKQHSINTQLTVKSIEPSLANRTGDTYLKDEYEVFIGNPNLKDYLNYNWETIYSWQATKRLTLSTYLNMNLNTNHIYEKIDCDTEKNLFTFRPTNGGRLLNLNYELGLEYSLIPRRFMIGIVGDYIYSDLNMWNQESFNSLKMISYCTLLYKGWKFSLDCTTKNKTFNTSNGNLIYHPTSIMFTTSYSTNNLNITLGVKNPFIQARTESYYFQNNYEQYFSSRKPYIDDNIFSINIDYRFTFGKKKHKFDNTEVKDINQSTIMQ